MTTPRIVAASGTTQFIRDYIAGAPALAPFYTGHPHDHAAYHRKADEVRTRMDAHARARVADAYRPLNDGARAKLDRILGGDGFVVTTGQQAGLFTGPLYTVYKALSAVRLAEELERRMSCPVLAVFWVAADDHDWAEVDHVRVLDGLNYVRDVRVPAAPAPPWPMSRKTLGAGIHSALDEMESLLPADGFGADVRAMLRRTYTAERTVAQAFEEMLAELLAPFPIALVSSAHPSIKRAALPIMTDALLHAADHESAVARQTARLEAVGYRAQVALTTDASKVFLLRDTGRDRLLRDQGGWLLRRTGERIAHDKLLKEALADPDILSANVFLRPVVESAVFPTLAYVGGPAETAYFAQIGCLFEAYGIMPPLVFPRHGLTLVEPKADATLSKLGYDMEGVRGPFSDVVTRLVRAEMPATVSDALAAVGESIGDSFAALEAAVPSVDPTLAGPVRSSRYRATTEVRRIEKQIERQYRVRHAERIEQLRKAASSIYPDGAPQERVLNIAPFLATWGPGLLQSMHDSMPVALDRSMPEWSGVRCDTDQERDADR